jgi:putative endonuclease
MKIEGFCIDVTRRRTDMGSWFVYVVRCRDGSLYTGISTDVEARIARHNAGDGARYTRARRPVQLLYVERKRTQSTALRREAFIKTLSRPQKLGLIAVSPASASARSKAPPAHDGKRVMPPSIRRAGVG